MAELSVVNDPCCRERMASAKELIDHRFDLRDEALSIQAKEYERRLVDLNHNLRMMLDDRQTFTARETFDVYVAHHQTTVDTFRTQINDVQKEIGILNTRLVTWTAAIGAGFAILNIALHFWAK